MRYLFIILFVCFVSLPFSSTLAQKNEKEIINYKGGIANLNKDLVKNIQNYNSDSFPGTTKNYIIFLQITLSLHQGIRDITVINREDDPVINCVINAVRRTSKNWSNISDRLQRVILPVFLIKDNESGNIEKDNKYMVTSKDYKQSNFIESYFISPVIINFFSQK